MDASNGETEGARAVGGGRWAWLVAALLAAVAVTGCRGPDDQPSTLRLEVDTTLLVRDWEEGPRRDAIEALLRRQGREFVARLFRDDPMPSGMPRQELATRTFAEAIAQQVRDEAAVARRDTPPAWWNGVPPQPEHVQHDLPREYVVSVQRGETIGLLARWSHQEVDRLRDDNREALGKRRWLRPGDALQVTMSANQKLAFDQSRERFQASRLDAYFAKRYIERVVVYVVQRGDMIARVARQYGEAPIWLLEAFNQADFRALQPGDTILIPVVKELRGGRHVPPRLQVVDASGRPLTEGQDEIRGRLPDDLLRRARVAIDDSNVFERGGALAGQAPSLLPRPGLGNAALPAVGGAYPTAAVQAAPHPAVLPAPLVESRPAARQVLVKTGETLSHFAAWSGLTVGALLAANPGLQPDRITVGQKVILPLTDLGYADFVLARAGGLRRTRTASGPAAAPSALPRPAGASVALAPRALPARIPTAAPRVLAHAKPAPAPKRASAAARTHTVAAGETGGGIAVRYGVSLGALLRANAGRNLDRLFVGDQVVIPAPAAVR